MKTTVVGAYPKISDEHQDLRRALHRVDRGELDESGIAGVFDGTTAWAIAELESAGIDVINDGQIRWDDLLAPFARAWKNTERGPLERFYDNNTYFRQPIIKGPIETDGQTLVRDFKFADSTPHGKASLKGAVCGPLTFATLTAQDTHYKDLEARTLAAADAIAKELSGLKAAGAKIVDVEEPALAAHPELIELERAALERLTKGGVTVALYPYFFPIDRIIEKLDVAPVGVLGVDVRSREMSHKAIERLGAFKGTVSLGVVDGRNTRIETQREIGDLVDAALKQLGDERRLYLSTTTGLEYLPHDIALKKLAALAGATRVTGGVR
jgi:5-methyltetrahydropteroyltriglutamate--homocysteine methyltransferase